MEKKSGSKCSSNKSKKTCFQLAAPKASNIILTGDFIAWSQEGVKMKRDKNGVWKIELDLNPGRYEYKFIVDGKWWTDPSNKKTAVNSFGETNSVLEVCA